MIQNSTPIHIPFINRTILEEFDSMVATLVTAGLNEPEARLKVIWLQRAKYNKLDK